MEPKKGMIAVYEHEAGKPLADNEYDGMEDLLEDDHLPTDWDIEIEDPPHEAWYAHIEAQEAAEKAAKGE